jgi:hypothetical protein
MSRHSALRKTRTVTASHPQDRARLVQATATARKGMLLEYSER